MVKGQRPWWMECVKRWIDWSAVGLNHFYNLEILSQKSCASNSNPGMAITLLCGIGQLSCSSLSFMRIHHLQRAKWLSPWSGTSLFTKYIGCPITHSLIHPCNSLSHCHGCFKPRQSLGLCTGTGSGHARGTVPEFLIPPAEPSIDSLYPSFSSIGSTRQ
jgi:hypothetical protein